MIKRFVNWAKNENIWDLLAWASLAMIFLWLVAKLFGLINTPLIIELMPYFGVVFFAGRMFQKVEMLDTDMNKVKDRVYDIDRRIIRFESKSTI